MHRCWCGAQPGQARLPLWLLAGASRMLCALCWRHLAAAASSLCVVSWAYVFVDVVWCEAGGSGVGVGGLCSTRLVCLCGLGLPQATTHTADPAAAAVSASKLA